MLHLHDYGLGWFEKEAECASMRVCLALDFSSTHDKKRLFLLNYERVRGRNDSFFVWGCFLHVTIKRRDMT